MNIEKRLKGILSDRIVLRFAVGMFFIEREDSVTLSVANDVGSCKTEVTILGKGSTLEETIASYDLWVKVQYH